MHLGGVRVKGMQRSLRECPRGQGSGCGRAQSRAPLSIFLSMFLYSSTPHAHAYSLLQPHPATKHVACEWSEWLRLGQAARPSVSLLCMQGTKLWKWREALPIAYAVDILISKGIYLLQWPVKSSSLCTGKEAGETEQDSRVWPCLRK